jgi:protein-S-isoprenylcysteine O-methyltransferase Ste14
VEKGTDVPGVLAPPPLIFLLPLLAGLILERIAPSPFQVRPWWRWVGIAVLGLSLMIVSALRAFRRARTRPEPWKPTTALVVDGPYRFSRNPMYVGFALAYVGVSLSLYAVWPLLMLPAVLMVTQRFVIEREERYLSQKFGDEYRAYVRRVRRWL